MSVLVLGQVKRLEMPLVLSWLLESLRLALCFLSFLSSPNPDEPEEE
jgi:hypothetical protein